jgi:hypothetical protein
MFKKNVRIWITGVKFVPIKLMSIVEIKFEEPYDVGSFSNRKTMSVHTFGSAIIKSPLEIYYDPQIDAWDERISWLLDYLEDKIEIIKKYGGDEIILDIEYNLDIENISQRYVDSLSIDQMAKMAALGIKYEVTIWPNFIEN